MISNTAILFFTRTVASEAAAKAFVPFQYKKTNCKIASAFINNTRKTVAATGLPVFEINEQQQIGDTFGERLSNAVEEVFSNGIRNVIIIGNDCAQLTTKIIATAQTALTNHSLVLGADNHGGAYLIGINKEAFVKETFATRQWQTATLLSDLEATYNDLITFHLPHLNDANSFKDLISLKNLLPAHNRIKALVTSFVASFVPKYIHSSNSFYSHLSFSLFGLRAPPRFN